MARAKLLPLLAVLLGLGELAACTAPPPARAPASALISTRLRRLSRFEYQRSASRLLGLDVAALAELPPDERQDGYSINERQAVPSYFASELQRVADGLAQQAAGERGLLLLPCPENDSPSSPCAQQALARLAVVAWRRPATDVERASLTALLARGGLRLVLSTLLASPGMLYLSELGDGDANDGGPATLSSYEIASSLAYAVSGAPPDAELMQLAAQGGRLRDPAVREAQARRLLSLPSTRHHFREFVLEWLEVAQLEHTAKAAALVPDYDQIEPHMRAETTAFIDEVMVYGGASLSSLLAAGFTSPDPTMSTYYGVPGFSGPRVSLARQGRVGVLQQASFLSAHAYEDVTSPVKRGDFVLRRVLCIELPRPGELGIDTTAPPPDEHTTTRVRFEAHTASTMCRSCHDLIDPLGFSFGIASSSHPRVHARKSSPERLSESLP